MKLERLLQLNIAALTVVGTLLLGLGQSNPLLPALSLFAAATSIYFTDVLGWFRLHRVIANVAALGALFISMREFDIFGGNSNSQLRAIANLLVYLQFVLLYQEKNQRVYWQLAVLSLLQVVVAAALDLRIGLGVLLMIYMFTALSAMSLLFIHKQSEALEESRRIEGETSRARPSAPWSPGATLQIASRGSQREIERALLGWRFVRRLGAVGVVTWVLALAAFFAMPRRGTGVWPGARHGGARTVGFSREIRLGEMSAVLQNEDQAMRLKLTDAQGAPVILEHEPYIRGGALSVYRFSEDEGHWTQAFPSAPRLSELPKPPTGAEGVKAEFLLDPTGASSLFTLAPCFRSEDTPEGVMFESWEEHLTRNDANLFRAYTGGFCYTLITTGIHRGRQDMVWARPLPVDPAERRIEEVEMDRLLAWNPYRFRRTAEIAARAIDEAGLARGDRFKAAKTLEAFFLRPGLFTYTLDAVNVSPRPADVDPVEYFVADHRQGHCEYFASALAIMLRSQEIPARIVVGYHGGEYNSVGKYYQVRQRDAHAWVEAYLVREDLPRAIRAQLPPGAPGGWLRLDPTPSAPHDGPQEGVLAEVADATNYLEAMWNDYVLGLDSNKQQQTIYRPVVERVRRALREADRIGEAFANQQTWSYFWHDLARSLNFSDSGRRNAVVAIGLVLVLAAFAWQMRFVRRGDRRAADWDSWLQANRELGSRLYGWITRRRSSEAARREAPIVFYRRLEKLLARRRFRRQKNQTQREFALEVADAAAPGSRPAVQALLERVVDAYYRVRFGGRPLDSSEAAAIEKALEQLAQTLARRHA